MLTKPLEREEATKDSDFSYDDFDDYDEDNDWNGETEWTDQEEGEAEDAASESAAYMEFLNREVSYLPSFAWHQLC